MTSVSRETPALRDLERYLAGPGIERGLIGPREAERLWDRHILNCAVVAWDDDLIPADSSVVDVGSGAGLPGVVWALARPDLRVTLLESLQRRTTFLTELVDQFDLGDRVEVLRARAEEVRGVSFDVATARAVAPLPKLLPWLAGLTDGQILALKGRTAAVEVDEAADLAHRLHLSTGQILTVGAEYTDPPTTVVRYRVTTT